MELVVTTTKSSVKADVRARSRGLYDVTFVPQEAVSHFVNITFNDEDVPGKRLLLLFLLSLINSFIFKFGVIGSPFKCEIYGPEGIDSENKSPSDARLVTAKAEGLKEVVLGAPAFFEIDAKGMEGLVDIKITGMKTNIMVLNQFEVLA